MTLSDLMQAWLEAKSLEQQAKQARHRLEDAMLQMEVLDPPDSLTIKITPRVKYHVNQDKLQQLAEENGLTEHLTALFRWMPELNLAVWMATDKAITEPLLPAIKAEQGRPSFSITRQEANECE